MMRGARVLPMRTLGAAATLVALTSLAGAAPIATERGDLDGDGAEDAIELHADGTLRIAAKRSIVLRVAPGGATRGKVTLWRGRGRTYLVVEVDREAQREGVVLEATGTAWREVVRMPLGGVGLDDEYGVGLDVTPRGIYRYQFVGQARRCDGRPAYLFPEGFDPQQRKFRPVVPPPPYADGDPVATLPARVDPPGTSPVAPVLYRARLASTQPGARNAGALSIPSELDDGKLDTVWTEDLSSDGHGQFFTFEARRGLVGMRARQLRIVPGRATSAAAVNQANRPRELAILTASGMWKVELPDVAREPLGTAYTIDLPQAVDGCVTVVLMKTWGPAQGTTAISELAVFADGERTGGGDAMLASIVAQGKDGATAAAEALARRGVAGVGAIDAEIRKATDPVARRRLLAVLVKVDDPAAVTSLARAVTERWATGPALLDLIDALGKHGLAHELHALAADGGVEVEARIAAVGKLRGGDPAVLPLLLELAGTGPQALRRAVIDQLASASVDALVQAAAREVDAPVAGDVWRALTRKARGDASLASGVLPAMLAALPGAADYERRYRLVDGIATLGDAPAMATLAAYLRGLPAGVHTAALRQVAVLAIGTSPRPAALRLVQAFAVDPDPGVRLAVLGALAGATTDAPDPWHTPGGPDGIDRLITNALVTDTWPDVRRRAAAALATRCQRPGPARALTEAVAKDRAIDVRIDALSALVQCHAHGIAALLARTWDDGKAPIELRTQAVRLAITLEDRALGGTLVSRFTAWRGAAIESAEALALAQSAAAAIALLDAPGAVRALTDALDDAAFPEIVAAAARALGSLGPRCPAAAKAKLQALAQHDDQSARAAGLAAAACGGR